MAQAVDPETGAEVPDGQWGNLVVTTLDRDNPTLGYDLDETAADAVTAGWQPAPRFGHPGGGACLPASGPTAIIGLWLGCRPWSN